MAEAALARIGRDVTRRLSEDPLVSRIEAVGFPLFARQDLLDGESCARLIAMIDACAEPSGLMSDAKDPEFRTSSSGNVDRWDPLISAIDRRICDLLGLPEAHGETMQGQRYRIGEQFKPHHDFFFRGEPYWHLATRVGGQRSWTAMIYLNQPEAGGETAFPQFGIAVPPLTGMLLTWNNMDADGRPNMATLHAGMPVKAGTKYIITKWFREARWVTQS